MKREDAAVAPPEVNRDNDRIMYDCLRHAVADTQAMLRTYDTKAQVLIALLTFSVGAVGRMVDDGDFEPVTLVIGISAVVFALYLCACVLYPRIPKLHREDEEYLPSETYYLPPELLRMKLAPLIERVRATNWLAELVYELRTLGTIRQCKAFWLKWACLATGLTVAGMYGMVFLGKLW
jgi:hypothetical protein